MTWCTFKEIFRDVFVTALYFVNIKYLMILLVKDIVIEIKGIFIIKTSLRLFVKSSLAKLSLFSRQAGKNRIYHFPLLKQKTVFGEMTDQYKAQLDAFAMEFERRFQEYTNLEPLFNIPSSQLSAEADKAPEDIELLY